MYVCLCVRVCTYVRMYVCDCVCVLLQTGAVVYSHYITRRKKVYSLEGDTWPQRLLKASLIPERITHLRILRQP